VDALKIAKRNCVQRAVDSDGSQWIIGARIGEPLPHANTPFIRSTDHVHIASALLSRATRGTQAERLNAEPHVRAV
jgi:hypothetical protein